MAYNMPDGMCPDSYVAGYDAGFREAMDRSAQELAEMAEKLRRAHLQRTLDTESTLWYD